MPFVKVLLLTLFYCHCSLYSSFAQNFSIEQVTSYPFPSELCAAPTGSRIAWALNEQGKRNIYVAEGPSFKPKRLTAYLEDDGQELTSLSLSSDGRWVVFVRGGEHGGSGGDVTVNPTSATTEPKVQVWSIAYEGGEPLLLGEGDLPVISPDGKSVAYLNRGKAFRVAIDGSEKPEALFEEKGRTGSLRWSPDGSKIAFVSSRGTHAYIGVHTLGGDTLQWLDPAFSRDSNPTWSEDGNTIAFIRTAGSGGKPDSILALRHQPWEIRTASLADSKGKRLWKAPATLRGSVPTTHGGFNLHWAAGNRVTFLSYHDGWPHLYSITADGGEPLLLTAGDYMTEHIQLSPDKKWLLFSANHGKEALDIDRRHVFRVPVDKPQVEALSEGETLEAYPVMTGDGQTLACFAADAQKPFLTAVRPLQEDAPFRIVGADQLPNDFPHAEMVKPTQVVYTSSDGLTVHAQLFEKSSGKTGEKKPAIVFVHGGPQRQMLLGWSYMDYYANNYAINQYLANLGYIVLSVNYRLGIGYGYEFHKPPRGGSAGAAEYLDIKAAGEWLAQQPQVDASRIGIYGGSYGGFLTAMALGKDSELFKAGVDIHGVHKWQRNITTIGVEVAPDAVEAEKVLLESSPINYVDTWKSPVLLIHGDDDRNVPFSQTVDLAKRLDEAGVVFEQVAIPDDSHHWMRYKNITIVNKATVDFLHRKLSPNNTKTNNRTE